MIDDDGDEVVTISIDGKIIGEFSHAEHGWAGMEAGIEIVESIAKAFNIPIFNNQDIV